MNGFLTATSSSFPVVVASCSIGCRKGHAD